MRIVVTGMGIVSPIGIGVDQFWTAAVNGVSGIRTITGFDPSSQRSQVAGEIPGFDPASFLTAKYIDQTDRFTQLALLAAKLALEDAGGLDTYAPQRVAISIGSGMGGFGTFESSATRKFRNQPIPPFTVPRTMANAAAAWIAIKHRFKGVNLTCSTACSSGANAIGMALDLLRTGRADAVIAGGAEGCVLPLTMTSFEVLHALTTGSNADPARASRPFAKGRDGFAMAEGAGMLILEREDQAQLRGAKMYACLAGYGQACDATHIVMPDMEGQITAMRTAVLDAGMNIDSIDHINAHATSTPLGDIVETRAIKNLFGTRAGDIAVNATKSMIGHSIGASAAMGSIATIMALHTGTIHPTINLDEADPECDLDYIPNRAQQRNPRNGLCNAFGFGGNNASIIFTTLE
ncbi:beta-ketoacyl synthase [Nitrosospira sp. NpAV]|uniref:beta-ketoacyl-[acyl-carrier-protein] synthase family protein n=1 Tax=Nitrosospira sp. NpAV TaxID=58133 RepID=UPI00059F6442|nr:beta-ketoacyl-[acyl-carrier-protein] synthase family protein [Nitrosospira sp. NpAV]KIO50452.1 3-oxoacyl-ACP synthase [Nitrosospira sp. NpAV]